MWLTDWVSQSVSDRSSLREASASKKVRMFFGLMVIWKLQKCFFIWLERGDFHDNHDFYDFHELHDFHDFLNFMTCQVYWLFGLEYFHICILSYLHTCILVYFHTCFHAYFHIGLHFLKHKYVKRFLTPIICSYRPLIQK